MTFPAIVEAAAAAGLAQIGIADHPFRRGLGRHHEALAEYRAVSPAPVRIWIGAELEVAGPARLILDPARLPLADYILAAPSHYDLANAPPVRDLRDPVEWADRLLTDIENVPGSGADAVAHPFFVMALQTGGDGVIRLPFLSEILNEMRPRRLDWMLGRLADDGLALEVSPRLTYLPVFERFMIRLYRKARARGVRFLLGSDSHRVSTIGGFQKIRRFLDHAGIGPADLWHPGLSRRRGARG